MTSNVRCRSCCVDEVAAEHVDGDCVIHFGHACLSRNSRLPVLHILPRASLEVAQFVSAFGQHLSQVTGVVLLLYDVAFSHLVGKSRVGNLFMSQFILTTLEFDCF